MPGLSGLFSQVSSRRAVVLFLALLCLVAALAVAVPSVATVYYHG
jgi:hypothetical protein